jgi:PPM family protein phosphatase
VIMLQEGFEIEEVVFDASTDAGTDALAPDPAIDAFEDDGGVSRIVGAADAGGAANTGGAVAASTASLSTASLNTAAPNTDEDVVLVPEDEDHGAPAILAAPSAAGELDAPDSDALVTTTLDEGTLYLEDEVLPSTLGAPMVADAMVAGPVSEFQMDRDTYAIVGRDPLGREVSKSLNGTQYLILPYPDGARQARELYPHPFLPEIIDEVEGQNGVVYLAHPLLAGETLEDAMRQRRYHAVARTMLELAKFNRYLAAKGYSLNGFEPRDLLTSPPRLQRLPRLVKLGDAPPAEAPRYGAPERATGANVTGAEGAFTIGALIYHAFEGRPLAEGEIPLLYPAFPGVPQALSALLAPAPARAAVGEVLELMQGLERAHRPRPVWRVGSATSVGINPDRPVNEDSAGWSRGQMFSDLGAAGPLVACVADGMGGMARGEIASQAAVGRFLNETLPPIDDFFALDDPGRDLVRKRVVAANAAVVEALEGRNGGCTFTGLVAYGSHVAIGHVGDTRAYLVSTTPRKARQLTEDHSVVAMLVKMGMISEEAAHNHPDSNKVTRALGTARELQHDYVDTIEAVVQSGERLAIMSDGVWGPIEPKQLGRLLAQDGISPQDLADQLVSEALKAGSSDNCTAIVLEYQERPAF